MINLSSPLCPINLRIVISQLLSWIRLGFTRTSMSLMLRNEVQEKYSHSVLSLPRLLRYFSIFHRSSECIEYVKRNRCKCYWIKKKIKLLSISPLNITVSLSSCHCFQPFRKLSKITIFCVCRVDIIYHNVFSFIWQIA